MAYILRGPLDLARQISAVNERRSGTAWESHAGSREESHGGYRGGSRWCQWAGFPGYGTNDHPVAGPQNSLDLIDQLDCSDDRESWGERQREINSQETSSWYCDGLTEGWTSWLTHHVVSVPTYGWKTHLSWLLSRFDVLTLFIFFCCICGVGTWRVWLPLWTNTSSLLSSPEVGGASTDSWSVFMEIRPNLRAIFDMRLPELLLRGLLFMQERQSSYCRICSFCSQYEWLLLELALDPIEGVGLKVILFLRNDAAIINWQYTHLTASTHFTNNLAN